MGNRLVMCLRMQILQPTTQTKQDVSIKGDNCTALKFKFENSASIKCNWTVDEAFAILHAPSKILGLSNGVVQTFAYA